MILILVNGDDPLRKRTLKARRGFLAYSLHTESCFIFFLPGAHLTRRDPFLFPIKTQTLLDGSSMSHAAAAKSLQSCLTLWDPIASSPPGSPVPGILQARTLEWVAISFSNAWKWKVKGKSLSHVRLFATPWTAAYQAPPSMGFSRQGYWSGLPLPSPNVSWGQQKKKTTQRNLEDKTMQDLSLVLTTHFHRFGYININHKMPRIFPTHISKNPLCLHGTWKEDLVILEFLQVKLGLPWQLSW